jgi:hypothetical protein
MRVLRLCLLILAAASTTACGLLQDRRDAPWDPKAGAGIGMDQIPNWQSEALQVCGGHLPPAERKGRSPRC